MAILTTTEKVTVNLDCDRRKCRCWCHTTSLEARKANNRPHVPECEGTYFPNAKAKKLLRAKYLKRS